MRFFCLFLLSIFPLMGEIKQIEFFEEMIPDVDSQSMVLLDIDETLIESPVQLGSAKFRSYVKGLLKKRKTPEEATRIHDQLTYWIASNISYVCIEKQTRSHCETLQRQGASLFCLTARAKEFWYNMPLSNMEDLTMDHLSQAGFSDLFGGEGMEESFLMHPNYSRGVFFSDLTEDKADVVYSLFFQPTKPSSKVIFIDDKMENVLSVHEAFEKLGIPSICFHYRHTQLHRDFDPMISNIQMEKLIFEKRILSDSQAALLKQNYQDKDPDLFFLELLSHLFP